MKRFVGVFVVFLAVASVAVAGTTGRLAGTVMDDQGQPLPGVTVTVSSPTEIGGAKVEVTDADGNFAFPALTPGFYTVKLELSGFVTQERNEVQVRLDHTTELSVQMPLGKFAEEVTVVAETPVVDPTQVSTSQTFTPEFLKGVAVTSGRRGYQSVLNMAPGVVGGGNPSVYGSSLGENVYLIDGVNTTDPVTATFGTNFTFDAIQEISFQTGGFEAEYGQATGGVVNVVTKSGGNEFHGSFDVRYRDNSFYQDGDHFDKDDQDIKDLTPAVTLGGPVLRDKLWFFAGYELNDSEYTPVNSPTTEKFRSDYYLGKLTWQANSNWRLTAKYSADPADIDNAGADQYTAPEATTFQTQGADIYQADASGVLGPNLLLNLGVGIYRSTLDAYPQSGDFETPGHLNLDSGESYGNAQNAQYSDRNRDDYKGNLTWFVEDLAGSHELKGGIEYSDLDFWTHNYTPADGHLYYDVLEAGDNFPYLMYQGIDQLPADNTGDVQTLFVQDAWKVMPNLTLKLGVRYDTAAYKNDVGDEIADLDKVQPRLGLAWDITNDAKNVVKASWGRFMHPSALTLPNYARINNSTTIRWLSCSYFLGATAEECEGFATGRGWGWTEGPDGWDPGGWLTRGAADILGSEPTPVQNLSASYADELIIGFERELFNRTSIEVSYIDKKTKNLFEDTCQGNLTGDESDTYCSYYIIANLEGLERDYEGAIVKLETRATDWMWLLASYTYSKSKGNLEYTQGANTDYDFCPEHCENTYGYLSDDRRHRVKVNGTFDLPYNFRLGVDAFWSSAFAYSKTEAAPEPASYGIRYVDPRGAFRANDNYQLDLSVTYRLRLGAVHAELIGSVINVLDSERVTAVCQNFIPDDPTGPACGSTVWGAPIDWQDPQRFEVGFRIEF